MTQWHLEGTKLRGKEMVSAYVTCPKCRSENTESKHINLCEVNRLFVFAEKSYSFPAECKDCGCKFKITIFD
jgi:predicted nucleic-acid-binding Zn-ribbon protein